MCLDSWPERSGAGPGTRTHANCRQLSGNQESPSCLGPWPQPCKMPLDAPDNRVSAAAGPFAWSMLSLCFHLKPHSPPLPSLTEPLPLTHPHALSPPASPQQGAVPEKAPGHWPGFSPPPPPPPCHTEGLQVYPAGWHMPLHLSIPFSSAGSCVTSHLPQKDVFTTQPGQICSYSFLPLFQLLCTPSLLLIHSFIPLFTELYAKSTHRHECLSPLPSLALLPSSFPDPNLRAPELHPRD